MPTVNVTSFATASAAFNAASLTQQRANAVKLSPNTYLMREFYTIPAVTESGDVLKLGRMVVTGYAITFHGNKVIRFNADESIWLHSHGRMSPTLARRMSAFTPFTVSAGKIPAVVLAGECNKNWPIDFYDGMVFVKVDTVAGYMHIYMADKLSKLLAS